MRRQRDALELELIELRDNLQGRIPGWPILDPAPVYLAPQVEEVQTQLIAAQQRIRELSNDLDRELGKASTIPAKDRELQAMAVQRDRLQNEVGELLRTVAIRNDQIGQLSSHVQRLTAVADFLGQAEHDWRQAYGDDETDATGAEQYGAHTALDPVRWAEFNQAHPEAGAPS